MISKKNVFLSIMLLVVFLPGCGNNQSLAAQSVEEYFQAIVEKNQDMLVSKVCTSYEPNAMMDFNTFAIVKTSLENFSCQTTTTNENGYDVKCQGSLRPNLGMNWELSIYQRELSKLSKKTETGWSVATPTLNKLFPPSAKHGNRCSHDNFKNFPYLPY